MKKIIIFLMIIISMVYAQDSNSDNINTNEANTNFFNIPAETENDTNNEPAILEDIRNIEN